ncbi:glycosyltransferase [Microbacterium phage Juanyo]|nr:glycosyltransferase [Microbacterium phage Juanyo]
MTDERLPLLIPSYNRPGAPLVKLATQLMGDDYPWWVFVRKSQARDYRDAGADRGHMVIMPDAKVGTLGDTRNWMMRWATREGFDQVFDWDDDVARIGRKLPDGTRHQSWKATGNDDPWFDGPGYWEEASHLARQVFELYPGTVAGSIQNQRWASSLTLQVQCGKTPRRTKILNVERLVENDLWCPPEFRFHGEDIGNTAMYLQYDWQVFTICNLVYDFISETDVNLPSTLRSRDEDENKAIHEQEFTDLQRWDIADYLRVNKAYEDGSYMYGDVDWRKFRKLTGQVSYTHEFSAIMDRVPLQDIPCTITQ